MKTIVLCAALLIADRPFIVSWEVKWREPLKPTTHRRVFADADAAMTFSAAAPMCSVKEPPCVAWISLALQSPADPSTKSAATRR